RVARPRWTDRDDGDDGGRIGVLALEGHLDRVFVVRRDRPGDAFGDDRLSVGRDLDANCRVRHLLQRNEDLQISCWSPVYQSAKTTTANAMASITRVNAIAKMVVPSVKSTSSPAFPRRAPERRPGVSAPARPLPRRLPQA